MRIGIFFGGPSREREVSYAGGKTAYENIDKKLFTPVLVFVDSLGNFILVDKDKLYNASIRSFYPGKIAANENFEVYIESLQHRLTNDEQADLISSIGTKINPEDFKNYFDFAFIIIHGPDCEDGAIQGLLEWYRIPYMGPGLLGSSVGIDKIAQNRQIARANGQQKRMTVVRWENWFEANQLAVFEDVKSEIGLPIVVKAPHQGSSIGVAIVKENSVEAFAKAMNQCFFALEIKAEDWQTKSDEDKHQFAQTIANLDESIGYPVSIQNTGQMIYHPADLIDALNDFIGGDVAVLISANAEDQVLLEEFVPGQEFSCGVIQDDDGRVVALPPTEIVKLNEDQTFDFKTKYKQATTRKRIPVATSLENNLKIQQNVATVFEQLGMSVVTRIDGFLTADGVVLLHDPNTLPGMSPASLIFKQMAELGFNISQSITYFIRQSLRERIRTGKATVALRALLIDLDKNIAAKLANPAPLQHFIFRAADEELAKMRMIYNQLVAKGDIEPVPVLKFSEAKQYELSVDLLYKDTIEDIEILLNGPKHPLLVQTIANAAPIIKRFLGDADQHL